jgi:CubicO group peptidase (beta-lactamase class C family)
MKIYRLLASLSVVLLLAALTGCKNNVPVTSSLPRNAPEVEGVSSEGLITFLDSAAVSNQEFHSIMVVRHGKVIAEGWWAPYGPELRHTLYSTSKSFTSTAVGFAVTEKLLGVDDKVVSFFPDQLPDSVSPFLAEMTVRDLLTMCAGQSPDPTFTITSSSEDWVASFLALPVLKEPGSEFLYNSMATFMLSAIVQKVTGEKVIDYLRPRLFEPLGIKGMDWEVSPKGINTGGWGLRVKTEDMAKFGQLYLQKGSWNGKQVIPAEWIEEATTFKIDQAPGAPQKIKDASDWMQGYCYQFWRCRHNAFRADGAYGQYIIVMPDKDAVVAITAESPNMQDEINLVWNYILPSMNDEALPENGEAADRLKERLESLALPLPAKKPDPPIAGEMTGKKFIFEENPQSFTSFSLDFREDICIMNLAMGEINFMIPLGRGAWINSETSLSGPNIISKPGALTSNKIAAAYTWTDENSIEVIMRYVESPHHIKITGSFEGNNAVVKIRYSPKPGYDLPALKATMKQ